MKKYIIMCFYLGIGSTTLGAHLPLNNPRKIEFLKKRVSAIQENIKKKQQEIAQLETALKVATRTPESTALSAARFNKLTQERATLLGDLTVAQNSLKNIENLNK
jgi:predicted  nucleic acid-binding Zn-ribbon protein